MPEDVQNSEIDPIRERLKAEMLESEYGGALGSIKAFGEAAAESVPFVGGMIEDIAGSTPEGRKYRQEHFRTERFLGTATGIGAQIFTPEGWVTPFSLISKAGKAVEGAALAKGVSSTMAKSLGLMTEGSLLDTGNVINEVAMGDTKDIGERIATAVTVGGALGFGTGMAAGSIKKILSNKYGKVSGAIESEVNAAAEKEVAGVKAVSEGEQMAAEDAMLNAEERAAQVATGPVVSAEAPIVEALEEITKLPDDFLMGADDIPFRTIMEEQDLVKHRIRIPIFNIQARGVSDRRTGKILKSLMLDPRLGKKLINAQSKQKADWFRGIRDVVEELFPGFEAISDPTAAGDFLYNAINDLRKSGAEIGAKFFQKFGEVKTSAINDAEEIIDSALSGMKDGNLFRGKFLKFDANEGWKLADHDIGMGITEEAHAQLKKLLKLVNRGELTIGEIENARTNLLSKINYKDAPIPSQQIESMRKGLLRFLEKEVKKINPELDIHEGFKQWAIHEQQRDTIERLIGGTISQYAKLGERKAPEEALKALFKNSDFVKEGQNLFGADFNKHLKNYISGLIEQATDNNGVFSAKKFGQLIGKKDAALVQAFDKNPMALQEIRALTNMISKIPEAPPANAPDTAEVSQIIGFMKNLVTNPAGTVGSVITKGVEAVERRAGSKDLERIVNDINAGKEIAEEQQVRNGILDRFFTLRNIEVAAQKTQKEINNGINAISSVSSKTPEFALMVGIAATKKERDIEYNKISSHIQDIKQNPGLLIENLTNKTADMAAHAPQISAQIQATAVAQAEFLASKLPKEPDHMMMSNKWEPTDTEKAEFLHYYRAVNNPIVALYDIKNGVLTRQTVEACAKVYPKMYQDMCSELINKMATAKNNVPYQTKLMVSMFLNMPVNSSLTPSAILQNQQSLAAPSVQQNAMPQQGIKPTQKGLEKLGVADRILTPMQKSQQRRE